MEGDWGGEVGSQYEVIRNGDHMLTHFECDICHLCNIKEGQWRYQTLIIR